MLSYWSGPFAFLVWYLGTEDLAPPAGKNRLISSGSRTFHKSFPTDGKIVSPMKKAVLTTQMQSEMPSSSSSLSFLLSEPAQWLLNNCRGLPWATRGHAGRHGHIPGQAQEAQGLGSTVLLRAQENVLISFKIRKKKTLAQRKCFKILIYWPFYQPTCRISL